jgi:tRNA pseudouridine32 synthase/23S rRNA pseudouridine746 synthase
LGINDLKIGYEDDYIVVVDKPSGVLSMSSAEDTPSLCKTVYEAFGTDALSMEQMVVHRLGIDTGGLIVFARTPEAMRGLHTIFRSRQILKQYEALICGHLEEDEGIITMPLMRDYENPPYMRVSTRQHQEALATLDPTCVPKSFLEAPKPCITKYEVIDREEIGNNLPVTRVVLTSISGRTHQLNVHCAAFGHPIVADSVYGLDGEASPNGGLGKDEMKQFPSRASLELQEQIAEVTANTNMCIHASLLSFRHPILKTDLTIRSPAPF